MGLDTVELIYAVEERFSIRIRDSDASKMATGGDIANFVLKKLQARGETLNEADVWQEVQKVIVDISGAQTEQVTREARIVDDLGLD